MKPQENFFAKYLRQVRQGLRYQFTRIFFYITPRFRPSFLEKDFGVNFIGFAKGELGLGQAMRSMVFSALAASIPLVVRKFNARIPSKQTNDDLTAYFSEYCKYPINVICINPDTLQHLPSWVSYPEWAKTYNVGYWFWELENFPKKWEYATNIVDEIWVVTDYIANAMRKSGKKVVKIPFPLEFELPPESMNKQYFGIDPEKFTFIFSFDFLSSMERKNPQGVIMAFKLAFPDGNDSARLIIKTMNANIYPEKLQILRSLINGDQRIDIRDDYLTQNEMRGLIYSADCYVSMHRAEGLGLGMAEAMYMGKPTIATGYSGNLEFMNETNSILLPYKLVEIGQNDYPNAEGGQWAEPSIEVAALKMREVMFNKSLREGIGKNAILTIKNKFSYELVGAFLNKSLRRCLNLK